MRRCQLINVIHGTFYEKMGLVDKKQIDISSEIITLSGSYF